MLSLVSLCIGCVMLIEIVVQWKFDSDVYIVKQPQDQ